MYAYYTEIIRIVVKGLHSIVVRHIMVRYSRHHNVEWHGYLLMTMLQSVMVCVQGLNSFNRDTTWQCLLLGRGNFMNDATVHRLSMYVVS